MLEEFWLREPGMVPERLVEILRARNIEAILLPPQPAARIFPNLDYSHFAVVSFGYSLQPSVFHLVTNHHFHSMNLMLKNLREMGYERIGFLGDQDWDEKVENGWIGSLVLEHWRNPALALLPPLLECKNKKRDLANWVEKNRPDVVISHSGAVKWLQNLGYKIPRQIGTASLSLDRGHLELSGLFQNNVRIGEAAVDFAVSMLHSGERGIPKVPIRILVESEWNPGTTLRRQKPKSGKSPRV